MTEACRFCGCPFEDHDHEHLARECYPLKVKALEARLRELVALMEGDIAFGNVSCGETRAMVIKQARELVPDMEPPKTLVDLVG